MKRTEIIDQIKDIMRQIAPTAQTILFGSEARGDVGTRGRNYFTLV